MRPRIERLSKEIAIPEEESEADEGLTQGPDPEERPDPEAMEGNYMNCRELDETLEIRGGMQALLDEITLPDELQIDEITFLFRVNQRGIVDEYVLQTDQASDELTATFDNAFADEFSFEPIMSGGQAVAVECELTFPLRN